MDKNFIAQCDKEIKNNKHKGDWKNLKPSRKKAVQELAWHVAKLNAIILDQKILNNHEIEDNRIESIQEYAADVANVCEKIFTVSGLEKSKLRERFGEYGQSMGYKEMGWPYAYKGE